MLPLSTVLGGALPSRYTRPDTGASRYSVKLLFGAAPPATITILATLFLVLVSPPAMPA